MRGAGNKGELDAGTRAREKKAAAAGAEENKKKGAGLPTLLLAHLGDDGPARGRGRRPAGQRGDSHTRGGGDEDTLHDDRGRARRWGWGEMNVWQITSRRNEKKKKMKRKKK